MNSAQPRICEVQPFSDGTEFGQMAGLHVAEIPEGFLTSLGRPMLVRLYRALVCASDAFVFAAWEGEQLLGFICCATNTRRVYRHVLIRSSFRLAPAITRRAFSWQTLMRCWETFRYPAKRRTSGDYPAAEILNFCVARQAQGRGVGRLLFARAMAEYGHRGVRRIKIVTGATQKSAQRFYHAAGAQLAGEIEVHANVSSLVFIHEI